VKRWGAVLQGVLLTLLVVSVVVLALRVNRLEAALRQLPQRTSPAAELMPGMPLGDLRAIAADGSPAPVNLSGRKLLFVYSSSCPYSRQMFPVWAEMGRRAGFERTAYLSVDDPAAPKVAGGVASAPALGLPGRVEGSRRLDEDCRPEAGGTDCLGSAAENDFLLPRDAPITTAPGAGYFLAPDAPARRHFSRVPQTIVVAGGRVVSVDIGVLPSDAVERVLHTLNSTR
jgi:hypothetical protein